MSVINSHFLVLKKTIKILLTHLFCISLQTLVLTNWSWALWPFGSEFKSCIGLFILLSSFSQARRRHSCSVFLLACEAALPLPFFFHQRFSSLRLQGSLALLARFFAELPCKPLVESLWPYFIYWLYLLYILVESF